MKKLNKIFAIILAILMVTSIVPFTAGAANNIVTGTNGQDITWELNRTTGVLTFSGTGTMQGCYNASSTPAWTLYKSSIKKVVIGSGITSICSYAFYNCYNITEVSIPDSVNSIVDYAFGKCTGLESITIPYSVGVIQIGAFDGCTNLKDVYYNGSRQEWHEIIIDDYNENLWYHPTIHFMVGDGYSWTFDEETGTLTIIDEGAGQIYPYYIYEKNEERPWEDIIHDIKHIVIDENIKFVGKCAFAYADSLETVTMLGVEEIDYCVFDYCHSLKSITVSNKLKNIRDNFEECDMLTYIYYSGTQEEWNNVFINEHNEVINDVKVYPSDYVVYSGYGTSEGLAGNDDVVSWIFDANTYTLTVSGEGRMPDDLSMDELLRGPFYRYTGIRAWDWFKYDIKKVVVDDSITYIGSNSFRFMPHLTEVVIPATVTEIGFRAFRTCDSITDVYFKGTEEQWNAIVVGKDNESLSNATIHYNYVECEHIYEKSVITEPSCINYGYTTHICSICNESYVDSFVDLVDCTYVPTVTPPTCTEKGFTTYKCSVCHSKYVDDYVDKKGHDYEQVSTTPPTCTSQGYTTYTCKDCGKSTKDDYTSSLGHEMSDDVETVAPTCTEQGYKKSICTRCGTVFKSEYVDALGHDYIAVSTTAPNCTQQGFTTYECSICKDSYNDDYVDIMHNCDWEIVVEPTCTQDGTKTAICSVCSEEVTETISRLGHDYGELTVEYEATCTKNGRKSKKCSRCENKTGVVIVPALGHTFGEWEQVDDAKCGDYGRFERVCSTCNQVNVMSAPIEHKYESVVTAPTCTEQGYTTYTCECGDTYVADYVDVDTNNHSYTSEITTPATHTTNGVMTFTCSCGDTYTEEIAKTPEHTYNSVVTAPTCTEKGYITHTCECGDTYVENIDATGHNDIHNDGICDNCDLKLCDHNCHKEGFTGILWRIINVFNMLFGLNKTCECGVNHY